MTRNKFIKKCTYLAAVVTFLLGAAATGFAQNAGQFMTSSGNESDDEMLSGEEIQQLLINEGIPLTAAVEDQLDEESLSKYTLGNADVIEISVMRHPEVSGQYAINTEGKIQYEFVGDIKLAGLTKSEAVDFLTDALSKYIISPEVNIKISGYNSKVVYVIGEVGQPGKIPMRGDTITVREALIQAGLPLLSAKTAKGSLITPSADGHPEQKRVNVHKLLFKGDLRENLAMKPGDTLYVPPTIMARALRVIQPIAAPVGSARTIGTGF